MSTRLTRFTSSLSLFCVSAALVVACEPDGFNIGRGGEPVDGIGIETGEGGGEAGGEDDSGGGDVGGSADGGEAGSADAGNADAGEAGGEDSDTFIPSVQEDSGAEDSGADDETDTFIPSGEDDGGSETGGDDGGDESGDDSGDDTGDDDSDSDSDTGSDDDDDDDCVRTQGYWKNHHSQAGGGNQKIPWPLDEDSELCGQIWLDVFNTPTDGNAFYILAHQWMAASLNVAAGAEPSADVSAALAEAQVLLEGCEIADEDRPRAIEMSELLDRFNNGLTDHACPDDSDDGGEEAGDEGPN